MTGVFHKKRISFLGLSAFLSVCSNQVQASPEGLWFFGGGALGIEKVSSSIETEASKSGYHLLGKGLASYYLDSFVADAGLGFTYSKVSGSTEIEDISITMKSLLFETSFRYRIGDIQVGPILHYLFGTNLSYSELTDEKKGSLMMLGLHASYDLALGDNILRIGGILSRDFNESDRNITRFLVDIQYGFSLGGGDKSSSDNEEPAQEEPTDSLTEEMPEESAVVAQEDLSEPPLEDNSALDALDLETTNAAPVMTPPPPAMVVNKSTRGSKGGVVVRLPTDRFLFDTAMSHLKSPAAVQYIQSLGFFLSANADAWEKVEVLGHTDVRGKKRVNKELSDGRARTVYNVLVNAGVDTSRISHRGLGASKPLSKKRNAKAHALNRRVELKFSGVTQPELFSNQINELDQKYRYGTYRNPRPQNTAPSMPSVNESPYESPAEVAPMEAEPYLAPDPSYAPVDNTPVENAPDTLSSPDDYLNSPDFDQY